jgi:hypothetical protein
LCSNCKSSERSLWAIGPPYPSFETVETALFLNLVRCRECGCYWLEALYEPFASFRYAVKWPVDKATFDRAIKKDTGNTLYRWHEAEVRFLAGNADKQTLASINAHYQRSRGHVNLTPSGKPNPIQIDG